MISTGFALGTHRISSPRMTMSRKTRTALIAAVAGLLLGSLAFLFLKSNAAEHKTDAQALALLRELGELSRRWDSSLSDDALGE